MKEVHIKSIDWLYPKDGSQEAKAESLSAVVKWFDGLPLRERWAFYTAVYYGEQHPGEDPFDNPWFGEGMDLLVEHVDEELLEADNFPRKLYFDIRPLGK